MPRLPTSLIHRARAEHPLLTLLLRSCRDLPSARNELRWLREHAIANRPVTPTSTSQLRESWPLHLHRMCHERARGKPLQYILGTQPFGTLEILCKKGVLIPRPETETITTHLATLLLSSPTITPTKPLRILDLCTGTGCIPLHLHSLLSPHTSSLHLHGIDIAPAAIALARSNLTHNTTKINLLPPRVLSQITFATGDIFANPTGAAGKWRQATWDVLVSNPPYISPTSFRTTTSRSVRNYEPKSALVPSCLPSPSPNSTTRDITSQTTNPGDTFYPRLLSIAEQVSAQVLLIEVADMQQAVRVAGMVVGGREKGNWKGCEIWRDWPAGGGEGEGVVVRGESVGVRGEGNGRAVLAWRGEGGGGMVGR